MVIFLGDGRNPPVAIEAKYLAVYDQFGSTIYAADQLSDKNIRQAIIGDPDLQDIVLSNGMPFKPTKEVTQKFNLGDDVKVFSTDD